MNLVFLREKKKNIFNLSQLDSGYGSSLPTYLIEYLFNRYGDAQWTQW